MEKIQAAKSTDKIYFLNIPNEIDGAYVFRLGFPDALHLYGKDSSHFIAVNYLPRQDLEKMKKKIIINPEDAEIVLPPDIILKRDSSGCRQVFDHGRLIFISRPGDLFYFWNLDGLEFIQKCHFRSPG